MLSVISSEAPMADQQGQVCIVNERIFVKIRIKIVCFPGACEQREVDVIHDMMERRAFRPARISDQQALDLPADDG